MFIIGWSNYIVILKILLKIRILTYCVISASIEEVPDQIEKYKSEYQADIKNVDL